MSRTYVYRVGTAAESRSPFHRSTCWALARELDLEVLSRAAAVLPGDHSFLAFAKAGQEERGDRCVVHAAQWEPWSSLGVQFGISANRYLHHMVRYLVGTMVDIARCKRPLSDMEGLLQGVEGLETSPPAPPEGLFLSRVDYPPDALDPVSPPQPAPTGTNGDTDLNEDLP